MSSSVPDDLRRLAEAHGVATSYRNERREPVEVDPDVVVTVLGLLDVDAADEASRRAELDRLAEVEAAGLLAPTVAVRVDGQAAPLPGVVGLRAEDGTEIEVDGATPADLPLGWYRWHTADGQEGTLVAAPPQVPSSPATWGWMLQLYGLRSARSWGIGDLGDLREFVDWTAREHGAGAVLLNPLHAPGPTHPVQPSPYTPSSRRFASPLALRVTDLDAYRGADEATRAEVDALAVAADTPRIDHELVWAAKRSALEVLWRAQGRPDPLRGQASDGLRDWATYCALAERHGGRWSRWPTALRDVASDAVTRARAELTPRVAFHAWVQQRCAEQLTAVRDTAREAGMALGVLHDLAVGVDPDGADAWALSDVLAGGVSVGAPPDNFTPRGQNWGLPPWRPDRLAATGYAALRDMLRAVLAHADGLRIDHVAGLWRLWWIPPGDGPDRGAYVRYDADTMLAVLALEAHRAQATVVGEDLGTVEPEVTEALAANGMLGCAVGWFTRDTDDPDEPLLEPARWPARAAASLSTHDLPTATGFLRGEHVRVRAELGLLDDVPAEQARADDERAEWLTLLRAQDMLAADDAEAVDDAALDATAAPAEEQNGQEAGDAASETAVVLAMHRFLVATPSRLKLVSPYDVVGDPNQPNLPGTVDEYPNWRQPLPVTLEELRADPRVADVAAVFAQADPPTDG